MSFPALGTSHVSMEDKLCFRLDEEEEGLLLQLQEKGLERPSYTTSLNTPMWPLRKSIKTKTNVSTKACRTPVSLIKTAPVCSSHGQVYI